MNTELMRLDASDGDSDIVKGGSRPIALVEGGDPPTEYLMFGPGITPTVKGDLLFDDEAAAAVLAFYEGRGRKRLAGDWEHDSLVPAGERPPGYKGSPASHWFDLDVRPGPELWAAAVKWTPTAFDQIKNGEYAHTSPVVKFDKKTGRIVAVLSSALTNDPATIGQPQLVAATADSAKTQPAPKQEPGPMPFKMPDEMAMKMKALIDGEHADEKEMAGKLKACLSEGMPEHFKALGDDMGKKEPAGEQGLPEKEKVAVKLADAEKDAKEAKEEKAMMSAKLSALTGKATFSEQFAVLTAHKMASEEVVALTAKVASTKDAQIAAVLEKGKATMRLTPADLADNSRTKAGQYIAALKAEGNVLALTAFVDTLPARATTALTATPEKPTDDIETLTLTDDERRNCDRYGLKPDDMLKAKREHLQYKKTGIVAPSSRA